MVTSNFFGYRLENIAIIMLIFLISLNVIYLAYIFDFTKALARAFISLIAGSLFFSVMACLLITTIGIIIVDYYPGVDRPYNPIPALLLYLAIPICLLVSFIGSVIIAIVSGSISRKFLK